MTVYLRRFVTQFIWHQHGKKVSSAYHLHIVLPTLDTISLTKSIVLKNLEHEHDVDFENCHFEKSCRSKITLILALMMGTIWILDKINQGLATLILSVICWILFCLAKEVQQIRQMCLRYSRLVFTIIFLQTAVQFESYHGTTRNKILCKT